jgi:GNAT superfamily N-acetyltransferase
MPEDEHGESMVRSSNNAMGGSRNLHWRQPGPDAACMRVVARTDGKVVGRAVLEAVYPPFAELQNMYVMEPHRGRGVGGAMVDECIARAAAMGFMAVFLQTHTDYTPAQRLYARKGFLLAGKAQMLRLVRFLSFPVLDSFLYAHPLATYSASAGEVDGEWSLTWWDWATNDRLQLMLTGGTCDKDSDGYGPGLRALSLKSGGVSVSSQLSGPAKAAKGTTVELQIVVHNEGPQPAHIRTRLLLPPGCAAQGDWSRMGPAQELRSGEALSSVVQLSVTDDFDASSLKYATSESLPLTVEVFLGATSFWLTHALLVKGEGSTA